MTDIAMRYSATFNGFSRLATVKIENNITTGSWKGRKNCRPPTALFA